MLDFINESFGFLSNEERWGPYPTHRDQSVSEHSYEVAVLAHQLALRTDGADPAECAVRGLYHDLEEAVTGDAPRFAKRQTDDLKDALDEAEDIAVRSMLENIDNEYISETIYDIWHRSKYDGTDEGELVAAADILCAVWDGYREVQLGNSALIDNADLQNGVGDAKEICRGILPAEELLNEMIIEMDHPDLDPMVQSDAGTHMDSGLVLYDFWAEWCGPCQEQDKIFEKADLDVEIKQVDVETEEGAQMQQDMSVRSLPTLILFEDGDVVERWTGLTHPEDIRDAM
jgi:thioredoxin 1